MTKHFDSGLEADKGAPGVLKQVPEQDINQLIQAVRSVGIISGLKVKPNPTPNETVLIDPGVAYMRYDTSSPYEYSNGRLCDDITSQQQKTIDPVSGALKERWDMIVFYFNAGTTTESIEVVKGTEADENEAVLPEITEDTYIPLAFVFVNETTGNVIISSTDIIDRRVWINNPNRDKMVLAINVPVYLATSDNPAAMYGSVEQDIPNSTIQIDKSFLYEGLAETEVDWKLSFQIYVSGSSATLYFYDKTASKLISGLINITPTIPTTVIVDVPNADIIDMHEYKVAVRNMGSIYYVYIIEVRLLGFLKIG